MAYPRIRCPIFQVKQEVLHAPYEMQWLAECFMERPSYPCKRGSLAKLLQNQCTFRWEPSVLDGLQVVALTIALWTWTKRIHDGYTVDGWVNHYFIMGFREWVSLGARCRMHVLSSPRQFRNQFVLPCPALSTLRSPTIYAGISCSCLSHAKYV